MKLLPVYILAGGNSTRFGSDKARAIIEGQTMLSRIAQKIQPIASRITIVAQHDKQYDDLSHPTLADTTPNLGPMGGLITALRNMRDDENWMLLLSCDLLHIELSWLETLWEHREDQKAVAFRPDCWQPMLAIYHCTVIPEAQRRAQSQNRSMQYLLNALRVHAPPLPSDWPKTLQANHPSDLP